MCERCRKGVPTSIRRMPISRERNRARGISSCESGKKKTERPSSSGRIRASPFSARAKGAAMTRSKVSRLTPKACAADHSQRRVPSAPSGKAAGRCCAPRASRARAVSARKGWASRNRVLGPRAGSWSERRAGRTPSRSMPMARRRSSSWSSTTSARLPTKSSSGGWLEAATGI